MTATERQIDARLSALLADPRPAPSDDGFADRVLALARYELGVRRARRRAFEQVGREALGLVAVVASFVGLARLAPGTAAGLGDSIAFGSPAMLGLVMLAAWAGLTARWPALAR